jgi:hypothetical protein
MFACLHPSDTYFEENLSTLSFAAKTSQIANTPLRNDDPRYRQICDLQTQLRTV